MCIKNFFCLSPIPLCEYITISFCFTLDIWVIFCFFAILNKAARNIFVPVSVSMCLKFDVNTQGGLLHCREVYVRILQIVFLPFSLLLWPKDLTGKISEEEKFIWCLWFQKSQSIDGHSLLWAWVRQNTTAEGHGEVKQFRTQHPGRRECSAQQGQNVRLKDTPPLPSSSSHTLPAYS